MDSGWFTKQFLCDLSTVFAESFYLVLWEDEESVSIHSQKELLRPDAQNCKVGAMCVVLFGKRHYEGKIIDSGSSCKTFYCCHSNLECVYIITRMIKKLKI